MQVAIVTGTSKGLGFSISRLLLEQKIHVIGISRTENESLTKIASQHEVTYEHLSNNLGDLAQLKSCLEKINEWFSTKKVAKLYLVNNAAVLEPINHSRKINVEQLAFHVQVNTTAPMALMNEALHISAKWNIPFYGVNITSGAANRSVYGWSAYCSTKALINRYTKTVALEQETLKTGNKVFAFSPGVMDTNMQAQIRRTDQTAFKDVEQFIQYKEGNHLRHADDVGRVVIDILLDASTIENGKVYEVADYI